MSPEGRSLGSTKEYKKSKTHKEKENKNKSKEGEMDKFWQKILKNILGDISTRLTVLCKKLGLGEGESDELKKILNNMVEKEVYPAIKKKFSELLDKIPVLDSAEKLIEFVKNFRQEILNTLLRILRTKNYSDPKILLTWFCVFQAWQVSLQYLLVQKVLQEYQRSIPRQTSKDIENRKNLITELIKKVARTIANIYEMEQEIPLCDTSFDHEKVYSVLCQSPQEGIVYIQEFAKVFSQKNKKTLGRKLASFLKSVFWYNLAQTLQIYVLQYYKLYKISSPKKEEIHKMIVAVLDIIPEHVALEIALLEELKKTKSFLKFNLFN